MAVSIKYTGDQAAVITVSLGKEDYQDKVEQNLKEYRKKAVLPGFRPGKVPAGMIKKQFGPNAKLDALNELIQRGLYACIEDNKLRILGEPMPSESNVLDIEAESYEMSFDVALAPKVEVKFEKSDKLPYYRIEATEEIIDQQINQILSSRGKQVEVEIIEPRDLVRGKMLQQGDVENPLSVENAILLPEYIKNEDERAKFVGASVGSVILFTPSVAYDGNEAELASLLNIKKEEVAPYLGVEFAFTIEKATRHQPAEMNEEFFVETFGEESEIKDEASLREQISKSLREQFDPESDFKLLQDVRKLVLEKAGKVDYPVEILERFLASQNKEASPEEIKTGVENSLDEITFDSVRSALLEEHKAEISQEEIRSFAILVAKNQFAAYGMNAVPDEMLEQFADRMLKDEKQQRTIVSRVIDNRFVNIVKDLVTLEEQVVTPEEFGKIVNPEA